MGEQKHKENADHKNPRILRRRCGAKAALFFVSHHTPDITKNTTCLSNVEMGNPG
jgi:hypothetical protein